MASTTVETSSLPVALPIQTAPVATAVSTKQNAALSSGKDSSNSSFSGMLNQLTDNSQPEEKDSAGDATTTALISLLQSVNPMIPLNLNLIPNPVATATAGNNTINGVTGVPSAAGVKQATQASVAELTFPVPVQAENTLQGALVQQQNSVKPEAGSTQSTATTVAVPAQNSVFPISAGIAVNTSAKVQGNVLQNANEAAVLQTQMMQPSAEKTVQQVVQPVATLLNANMTAVSQTMESNGEQPGQPIAQRGEETTKIQQPEQATSIGVPQVQLFATNNNQLNFQNVLQAAPANSAPTVTQAQTTDASKTSGDAVSSLAPVNQSLLTGNSGNEVLISAEAGKQSAEKLPVGLKRDGAKEGVLPTVASQEQAEPAVVNPQQLVNNNAAVDILANPSLSAQTIGVKAQNVSGIATKNQVIRVAKEVGKAETLQVVPEAQSQAVSLAAILGSQSDNKQEPNMNFAANGHLGHSEDESDPLSSSSTANSFVTVLDQQNLVKTSLHSEKADSVSAPVNDTYNIAGQIVEHAKLVQQPYDANNSEMIIQLKPEHLGELTLKVAVDNGVVSATFHTNNNEVRAVIDASLQQLKQDLTGQGFKVDNVGVYAGMQQFLPNGQRENNQQQFQFRSKSKKAQEDVIETIDAAEQLRQSVSDTGVDYRV